MTTMRKAFENATEEIIETNEFPESTLPESERHRLQMFSISENFKDKNNDGKTSLLRLSSLPEDDLNLLVTIGQNFAKSKDVNFKEILTLMSDMKMGDTMKKKWGLI